MQATGRVTVKANGSAFFSKPGASAQVGGIQRPGDMTDQQTFYYKEKCVPGVIKATLVHMADTDLISLRDFKEGIVTFNCDTGVVYTMNNAVCSELGELKDGEVDVTFMGDPLK